MPNDSAAIDALLEASQAHAEQLRKLQGAVVALSFVCTRLADAAGLLESPDALIEEIKVAALHSRLPDLSVEAVDQALELILRPPRRS